MVRVEMCYRLNLVLKGLIFTNLIAKIAIVPDINNKKPK